MHTKKINQYGLTYSDIDKKVTRVKVLIFNSENKILLCNVSGKYTFIGGHVEENETKEMALIRELKEETGILLKNQDLDPFLKIEKLDKNHFNTGKNCLSEIYYYSFCADYIINKEKMNLDDSEREKHFFLQYMDINEFYDYLNYQIYFLNSELHSEMLYVLNYYTDNMCRGKSNEKRLQKTL